MEKITANVRAIRDFQSSQEKRHYPDDEYYQAVIDCDEDKEYIREYMRVWWEQWADEYDRRHAKKGGN